MARRLDPTIELQQIIRKQLEGALQGDVLTEVRRATQGVQIEFMQRARMAATGLKITEKTMPALYNLCQEVKNDLEFTQDIDFYIQGDSEINAYAYISEDADKPHIIVVHSALFNLMDDQELKYIIGHEIGHLFNKDSYITRLYDFIYPNEEGAPEIIKSRMKQYDQLAEYAADRYGYNACMDLGSAITALYKLTCGIDLKKMEVSIDSLIDQNFDKANELINNGVISKSDHPDIPLRIHAMLLYAKCKTIKALEENMAVLFESIPGMYHSDVDCQMALFSAAAGIRLAMKDGKMDKTEKDMIIEEIAKYDLEPSKIFKKVLKENVDVVFEQSMSFVIDKDPSKAIAMLKFYVELAFADRVFSKEELNSVMDFGRSLGLDEPIIYEAIADEIREHYWSLADCL